MSEVIVITSGKGGVGKTTTTANIGTGLAQLNKKVVMIDTDIGLRNLDVVMGLENRIVYNLVDVVEGKCRIRQALIKDKRYPELCLLPSAQTRDKDAVTPEQMVALINELREELAYTGAIFQTTIDSEVIAYLIARERIKTKTAEQAVVNAMKKLKGAYALVVSSPRKLIGARDPYGFKPLCIGKRDNAYILASETCALDTIGAEFVRDVEPGEVVTIDEKGIRSDKSMCLKPDEQARCVFEYIYFSRPDTYIDGVNVYDSRIMAGKFLAMDSPVDADIVVGVPESGNAAAMGYAMQSGIPYGTAFVKNSYVGRTFIKPQQKSRESSVRVKLNVLKEVVKGKRVIMIDDSIVRGTTSDRIVQMVRDAGATEVHMRISSPPFISECYFGTDIPSKDQLIANHRTIDEIRDVIGCDSLGYLKVERLEELSGGQAICKGCFTGEYPLEPPTEDIRGVYQK